MFINLWHNTYTTKQHCTDTNQNKTKRRLDKGTNKSNTFKELRHPNLGNPSGHCLTEHQHQQQKKTQKRENR